VVQRLHELAGPRAPLVLREVLRRFGQGATHHAVVTRDVGLEAIHVRLGAKERVPRKHEEDA
jgi:hypothetical protein